MLCELRVRDLLLLERLEMRLRAGFNVLTGETGAGKSVIVGALNLLLGGRASPDLVRPGCGAAEVEALFDLGDEPAARERLERSGVAEGDDLVVRRVVSASGRARAFVNGHMCSGAELARLGAELVDVSSQHQSVTLTDPATHLGFLDAFGKLEPTREQLGGSVDALRAGARVLEDLRQLGRDRAERDAFLRFQLGAIDEVEPREGEMDQLRAERARLRHASRLAEMARGAADRLVDADECVADTLRRLASELRVASSLDAQLATELALVEQAAEAISDAGRSLGRYAQRVHDDPSRLAEIEDRLFRLERLLRLHGPTEAEVLAARERLAAELGALEGLDERVGEAQRAYDEALARAAELARSLSASRKAVAHSLGEAIAAELAELGMGGAHVLVEVAPLQGAPDEIVVDGARLGRDGMDRVEFLIAPNKGIPPRPLRRIASGGELSRALLSLKRVLAASGPAGLYVFDEVDAGVGGAVAERIGRALADVARHRQVLCITHLAPIAARASAHFVVEKSQSGDVASSQVRQVSGRQRVREIARMLSGARVTQASLAAAEQMLGRRG
jgi:DNA repair protein RecN (Recombination protein N)